MTQASEITVIVTESRDGDIDSWHGNFEFSPLILVGGVFVRDPNGNYPSAEVITKIFDYGEDTGYIRLGGIGWLVEETPLASGKFLGFRKISYTAFPLVAQTLMSSWRRQFENAFEMAKMLELMNV